MTQSPSSPDPQSTPLTIIHDDAHLVVVDKPSGLVIHRGWANDPVTVVDLIRAQLGAVVHPIHRLDRGTSGVLIFARDTAIIPALQAQLESDEDEATPHKRYLAIVRGVPPAQGEIDHPIPRREDGPRVPARTRYRRLASGHLPTEKLDIGDPRCALVEAAPYTGRLHQVRLHLKHLGHPVLGDANHGKGPINRAWREHAGLNRLALHAASYEVVHPVTGEAMRFEAPLPQDLRVVLQRAGIETPKP